MNKIKIIDTHKEQEGASSSAFVEHFCLVFDDFHAFLLVVPNYAGKH